MRHRCWTDVRRALAWVYFPRHLKQSSFLFLHLFFLLFLFFFNFVASLHLSRIELDAIICIPLCLRRPASETLNHRQQTATTTSVFLPVFFFSFSLVTFRFSYTLLFAFRCSPFIPSPIYIYIFFFFFLSLRESMLHSFTCRRNANCFPILHAVKI